MLSFPNESFTRKFSTLPLLAPHPLPCSRETHFWYIVPDEVKSPTLLNQYLKILSPCERQAVLSIREDGLRKGALLARTLVRTALSRYTNCKIMPELLRFTTNKYGKPQSIQLMWQSEEGWSPPCLQFNISHTSSLIACGFTVDMQVGIDVEEKQRKLKHDVLSFARRFFSPYEVKFLHTFSDPVMQHQELIKLWTLKEAYVKALGRGFSAAPFRNFSIRHKAKEGKENASGHVVEVHGCSENLTTNWQFALLELSSHYVALCLEIACEKEGEENDSLKLKVWKTIPFVEDKCVSGTDAIVPISGVLQSHAF